MFSLSMKNAYCESWGVTTNIFPAKTFSINTNDTLVLEPCKYFVPPGGILGTSNETQNRCTFHTFKHIVYINQKGMMLLALYFSFVIFLCILLYSMQDQPWIWCSLWLPCWTYTSSSCRLWLIRGRSRLYSCHGCWTRTSLGPGVRTCGCPDWRSRKGTLRSISVCLSRLLPPASCPGRSGVPSWQGWCKRTHVPSPRHPLSLIMMPLKPRYWAKYGQKRTRAAWTSFRWGMTPWRGSVSWAGAWTGLQSAGSGLSTGLLCRWKSRLPWRSLSPSCRMRLGLGCTGSTHGTWRKQSDWLNSVWAYPVRKALLSALHPQDRQTHQIDSLSQGTQGRL